MLEKNKSLAVIQIFNVAVYCMIEAITIIKQLICQNSDAKTRKQNYWLIGTLIQFCPGSCPVDGFIKCLE